MSVKSLSVTALPGKVLLAALALAGGVSLAQAAPIAPAGPLAGAAVETVAYGCGPGFIPNRFGDCRPMLRPYGYSRPRPFYGPPPYYGPRYGYYRPRPLYRPFF